MSSQATGIFKEARDQVTAAKKQQPPRCPRCGSRLFQESEFRGSRLLYFWECSLGCSRQFNMSGTEMSHMAGTRRIRVIRDPVPA